MTDSDACPVVTLGWQCCSRDRAEVRCGSAGLAFLSFGLETFPTDQFWVVCKLLNRVILALLGGKTFSVKESPFRIDCALFSFCLQSIYGCLCCGHLSFGCLCCLPCPCLCFIVMPFISNKVIKSNCEFKFLNDKVI